MYKLQSQKSLLCLLLKTFNEQHLEFCDSAPTPLCVIKAHTVHENDCPLWTAQDSQHLLKEFLISSVDRGHFSRF